MKKSKVKIGIKKNVTSDPIAVKMKPKGLRLFDKSELVKIEDEKDAKLLTISPTRLKKLGYER